LRAIDLEGKRGERRLVASARTTRNARYGRGAPSFSPERATKSATGGVGVKRSKSKSGVAVARTMIVSAPLRANATFRPPFLSK
jgi:hypothetical protein